MATHPPKKPTNFRNFSTSPELDLHLILFCNANKISRSDVMRRALNAYLMYHAPELRPVGSTEDIIAQRWELRGSGEKAGVPNGPSKATLGESSIMKLHVSNSTSNSKTSASSKSAISNGAA